MNCHGQLICHIFTDLIENGFLCPVAHCDVNAMGFCKFLNLRENITDPTIFNLNQSSSDIETARSLQVSLLEQCNITGSASDINIRY